MTAQQKKHDVIPRLHTTQTKRHPTTTQYTDICLLVAALACHHTSTGQHVSMTSSADWSTHEHDIIRRLAIALALSAGGRGLLVISHRGVRMFH